MPEFRHQSGGPTVVSDHFDELRGHTTTQVGTLGELIASAGILHASNGQLSPFKPIADDDGLDLLVLNKRTRRVLPLQIKCRRRFDSPAGQTVEFDVRLKTLVDTADGHVLYIRLEGIEAKTFWLVPAADLHDKARKKGDLLVIVPSAKETSRDRFSSYRMTSFAQVAGKILDLTSP